MASFPETIKALQIQPDKTLKVVEIPFSSQDLVKNIPEDQIIVGVPSGSTYRSYINLPATRSVFVQLG